MQQLEPNLDSVILSYSAHFTITDVSYIMLAICPIWYNMLEICSAVKLYNPSQNYLVVYQESPC